MSPSVPSPPTARTTATAPTALPARRDLPLFDAGDLPWLTRVVDLIVAATGEPWRVLRERLDHTAISALRVAAILGALRRVTGGRAERTKIARALRARVLGRPALDDATRHARLAAAADELGLAAHEVANLLWIDLANERPVTLPYGRPRELELAAFANLDRIQRAVRRSTRVRLRVWGDAHELIRTARRLGLVATIRAEHTATVLDIVGPLALFHATTVYGRALAGVVPLLAEHARFELELDCELGHGPVLLRVAPPLLLPPVSAARLPPGIAGRLARDLAKAAPELGSPLVIERDPPPLAIGGELLFSDLRVGDWLVDIVGFATEAFLAARRASYAAAGITRVVLCVDEQRAGPAAASTSGTVLPFRTHVDARRLLALATACRSRGA